MGVANAHARNQAGLSPQKDRPAFPDSSQTQGGGENRRSLASDFFEVFDGSRITRPSASMLSRPGTGRPGVPDLRHERSRTSSQL